MDTHTFICATDGIRLDKFLTAQLPDISRSRVQQFIADGLVTLDGRPAKARTKVSAGMRVSIILPTPAAATLVATDIPLTILFEDDSIIVLNKPAGLVVHPAAGHVNDTLVNALLYHFPALAVLNAERPGIVHRLDRDTSGVMVVAKTAAALANLQAQFQARTVEKLYLALVFGTPAAPEGIIDVPLGRHPHLRQKFAPRPNGKPARTRYIVIETFAETSLLRVTLETGRTHQIRVHMAWLGHAVVGDTVYGRKKNRLGLSRQFLHAHQLSITHPRSGERVTFTAPLPSDLAAALAMVRSQ